MTACAPTYFLLFKLNCAWTKKPYWHESHREWWRHLAHHNRGKHLGFGKQPFQDLRQYCLFVSTRKIPAFWSMRKSPKLENWVQLMPPKTLHHHVERQHRKLHQDQRTWDFSNFLDMGCYCSKVQRPYLHPTQVIWICRMGWESWLCHVVLCVSYSLASCTAFTHDTGWRNSYQLVQRYLRQESRAINYWMPADVTVSC